jgi:CRISPR-associated protein Cas5t
MQITVPVCAFRKGLAREYFETEEVPPPSTLYGFLLSLVGEENRYAYTGTKIAYALSQKPKLSVLLRTVWRIKFKEHAPGTESNRRPEYQEILTNLNLFLWVGEGDLANRLQTAENTPGAIERYGGLSLGESRDLVNDIRWRPETPNANLLWIKPDAKGEMPLPVWVDHVGSAGTVWKQFSLVEEPYTSSLPPDDPKWINIGNK